MKKRFIFLSSRAYIFIAYICANLARCKSVGSSGENKIFGECLLKRER
jgi:hypothetical protein